MKIYKNKKGQAMGGWAAGLIGGAIAVVIVVMTVAFGQQFLTSSGTNFITNTAGCNSTTVAGCGAAYNSTVTGVSGLGTFSSNIGLISLAVVLVAVIGLLLGLWYSRQ